LSTLVFGLDRIVAFRPRWFDVPMLAWCFSGVATSLHNGLGLYDGLSTALNNALYWGLPYLIGRLYFGGRGGLRDLTVTMTVAGLCYVPGLYWEMRMSPCLLRHVYGIATWQGLRFGGYRPQVFFGTALECGLWNSAVSLAAWWLWRCGALTKLGQISFGKIWLPILLVTTILCRSTSGLIILAGGMVMLWASSWIRTRLLVVALLLAIPLYICLRIQGLWSGGELVRVAKVVTNAERAESLQTRLTAEDMIVAHASQQLIYGWGGWGRASVYYHEGDRNPNDMVPTDSLWISHFGTYGLLGMGLSYFAMELPVILFLKRFPVRLWSHPNVAPATVAAAIVALFLVDSLVNGFVNIIYLSLAGGLASTMPDQLIDSINGRNAMSLADHYYRAGRTSKHQGLFSEALTAWRRALDVFTRLTTLYPASADLQRRWCECANDLAWLSLNCPDGSCDPAGAVALASEVVRRVPDDGCYWNTLGVAYYHHGDFEAAVTALNRAMTLSGNGNPFDQVFLAMAHARLGEREQAQLWLAQAMFGERTRHAELSRFCEEAQSIIATIQGAAMTNEFPKP
jgi:tetratricopeptide (TPR) repeat protein